MSESTQAQIEQLKAAIAAVEAQRSVLGNAVVDASLGALREKLSTLQAESSPAPPPEERIIVTILFTDVVGSTSLAEKLDPEEWRDIIAPIHATAGQTVAEHQGSVVQYLGDGLLALFGAGQASERDPENAIRAGLALQSAISKISFSQPIQLRVGIHTGLVVLGELGSADHREFTASGDAMNLAARLQSAAPPGGVLISHDAYRHVRGVFDVTPQPPLSVKGKNEPLLTYLVRRAKPRPFRTTMRGVVGIQTHTIGRERELERLKRAYLDVLENQGVAWAQLTGEAGVGKSRMLQELENWVELRPEAFLLFRARAFAGDEAQPYALVRRMLFDRFQIAEDAPLAQAEAKWVREFGELYGDEDLERAHALGLLVGLPFNESPYIQGLRADPGNLKGRALVVSRELVRRLRRRYPVVLLLEDVQWMDESSWEWFREVMTDAPREPVPGDGGAASDQAPLNGMFALTTARVEVALPDWLTAYPAFLPIELQPLTEAAMQQLVQELFRHVGGVPAEVIGVIVERAEGVPYYAEEMVNWLMDRGVIERTPEAWRFVSPRFKESPSRPLCSICSCHA